VFLHAESSLPFCICAAQQPVYCHIHACTGSWLRRMLSWAPAAPVFWSEHTPPDSPGIRWEDKSERSKVLIRRLAPQIFRHGPPSITNKKCRASFHKFLTHTHTHNSGRCPTCTHQMIQSRSTSKRKCSWQESRVFLFFNEVHNKVHRISYFCTLPVPMLLAHTCTQHPPHTHAHHDHMHSGTLVSWASDQAYSFLLRDH
jgi:hypothetical protein